VSALRRATRARYQDLLEHDSDIAAVATWIAEVEREHKRLERELGRRPTGPPTGAGRSWRRETTAGATENACGIDRKALLSRGVFAIGQRST